MSKVKFYTRLSPEEHRVLKNMAQGESLSAAGWIRMKALHALEEQVQLTEPPFLESSVPFTIICPTIQHSWFANYAKNVGWPLNDFIRSVIRHGADEKGLL